MQDTKVALVTGAGSGIGRATAIELARAGFIVGLLGRSRAGLDTLAAALEREKLVGVPLAADVSDPRQMRDAIDQLAGRYGRLDVVVANAGINGTWAPIETLEPEEWDETISVNLKGTFLTIRYSVPHLRDTGGGSIVVVSSINGTRTFTTPGATAYAATKAAQLAMVQQLSLELARHSIRVNAVCPGAIETNIDESTTIRGREDTAIPAIWPEGEIPITGGLPGSARNVAKLIAFLAGEDASHITGTPVWIDGGQGLLR